MIPNMVFTRPVISLAVVDGLTLTGLFWLYHFGVLRQVISTDHTYLATGIFVVAVYLSLSLSVMAWELSRFISEKADASPIATSLFYTKFDVVAFGTVMLPSVGFLGTVIGLSSLMLSAKHVSVETFSDLVGSGTSTALYPTAVGLIGFLILSVKRFILTHSFRIHGFVREL
mgnify:CR=1 FL=1